MSRFFIRTLTLCLLVPPPMVVGAQVRGTVRDPSGQGIPTVTVTLWRGADEIARVTTDSAGRFLFRSPMSDGATAVVARRIGLRPAVTSLSAGDSTLLLTMEPIAQSLPVVTLTVVSQRCPNREAQEARELWERVRRRYVLPNPRDGLTMTMWSRRNQVRASEVGEIDDSQLRDGAYTIWGVARQGRVQSLIENGYAVREPERPPGIYSGDLLFFAWRYAPLWRDLVNHFAEDLFGQRHSFSVVPLPGGARIVFCGRRSREPYLEGTLDISADSALVRASWRFMTERPEEDAAAEVVFVPPAPGERAGMLVPARSAFWRRVGGQRDWYYQDAAIYRRWQLAPFCAKEDVGTPGCR
jgi:hypothetical protein